nr:hypothetical protein [Tanacetum cinerariifolium]
MKTKNKSVKRKVSFDECNEDHSLGDVGPLTAFGIAVTLSYGQGYSSNINESLPRGSDAANYKFCQPNVDSQGSLANTSSPLMTLTMTEASEIQSKADKGKIILSEPEIISLRDIKPTHTKKTIEGNAIQANMDLKDTDYFDQLLQLNNAYKISRFWCTETKKWQRTLDNKTTLNFGRYTGIEPIANDQFPEHYFKFIAYNEVQAKGDISDAPLTEAHSFVPDCNDVVNAAEINTPDTYKMHSSNSKIQDFSEKHWKHGELLLKPLIQ